MIGDYDPEDAYDADDPPNVRLRVLEAVVADLLGADPDVRRDVRRIEALRVVADFRDEADTWRSRIDAIRQALEELADGD